MSKVGTNSPGVNLLSTFVFASDRIVVALHECIFFCNGQLASMIVSTTVLHWVRLNQAKNILELQQEKKYIVPAFPGSFIGKKCGV